MQKSTYNQSNNKWKGGGEEEEEFKIFFANSKILGITGNDDAPGILQKKERTLLIMNFLTENC